MSIFSLGLYSYRRICVFMTNVYYRVEMNAASWHVQRACVNLPAYTFILLQGVCRCIYEVMTYVFMYTYICMNFTSGLLSTLHEYCTAACAAIVASYSG